MTKLSAVGCAVLLWCSAAFALYDVTRNVGASADHTDTSCTTAPLGSTCIGFTFAGHLLTIAPTFEGNLWGCMNNTIFHRTIIPATAWAAVAGGCLNSEGSIAAASDNANEVAVIGTDHFIYTRTSGAWAVLGASNVQADYIASGVDFDLWIKDHLSGHAKEWNGTSWGVRSTTFIPDELCVGDSSHVYSLSAGSLYKWNGTAWAVITGTPANLQHCAVQWNMGIFVTASDDRVYHQAAFTGTWHKLAQEASQGFNQWTIHCSTYNNCFLTSQAIAYPNDNLFHLNQGNYSITTTVSGSYANFCNNQPNGCPPGSSHSGSNQVTFSGGTNGVNATISGSTPQFVWNLQSSGSPNIACDTFLLPGDSRCIPSEPKQASCLAMGALGITPVPKSQSPFVNCLLHPIPFNGKIAKLRPNGWQIGVTVKVYFDPAKFSVGDSRIASICGAMSLWNNITGVHYNCTSTSSNVVKPTSTSTKPWEFITTVNDPTVTWIAQTIPTGLYNQLPINLWKLQTTQTQFNLAHGPYSLADYQKIMLHEEGHNNFLGDCATCFDSSSGTPTAVMYVTSSVPVDLPGTPTDCDQLWWTNWYATFAH
jgi:hypothetical protein